MSEETYLGDGLYASHDGWQFKLRAPNHDGDHVVYLEPSVLTAFQRYVTLVEDGSGSKPICKLCDIHHGDGAPQCE